MNTQTKLEQRMKKANTLLCIGLDSDRRKIPAQFSSSKTPQFDFNTSIIDATHSYVCAYKPNSAFYEMEGDQGIHELKLTMEYLQSKHPDIVTILDAKRGDIESTNEGYVTFAFDWLGCDAITLHPYVGKTALLPFLERKDKGCIILCRTSNAGAGEFQDLVLTSGKPLWYTVTEHVRDEWNTQGNCMVVVGATYPHELQKIRSLVPHMTILVPGVGTQGGDVKTIMSMGKDAQGLGLIINSSRGIIFSKNPALEAKKLRDEIHRYR